jgi:Na+/H+-translocating membrane pyrophosphatase
MSVSSAHDIRLQGGAWDNAKKYIESGHHGGPLMLQSNHRSLQAVPNARPGKGSTAHKAAVTGDTVGDPFKDTAGPSLHVIITSMATTIIVLGPLFIGSPLKGSVI